MPLCQTKLRVISAEMNTERFNDKAVVVALWQPGDRDGSDDSGSIDVQRKAASVCGVVGFGQVVAFAEGFADLLEVTAYLIRAAVKAGDDVNLALHPACIVGSRPCERGVEELLIGLAEAAYVDHYVLAAREREITHQIAKCPGDVMIEARKAQFSFLTLYEFDVFVEGHAERIAQEQQITIFR